MSANWPWVILGRVPRLAPIPSDAEAGAAKDAFGPPDFSIRVAPPPQVTVLTVAPLVHPDPNYPDKYPYILAAGPDCFLLNFAVEPFHGVNSAVGPQETYLIVARRLRTYGVERGYATAPLGERIPGRRGGPIYNVDSVGLVSTYDGDYTVAELKVDRGCEHARLFRFRAFGDRWIEYHLSCPLAAEDREWVPAGVVAQKKTLWWFDLSWGLLSCDPFVADPVLLFHKLPENRALDMARPDIHTRRCITVSRRELRYVEIIIIPEDGGDGHHKEAATVSMWSRIAAQAGTWTWTWEKKYAVSFEEIWNDDTYKDTGLPRKVPVLSVVCPTNPDLVYFALEQRLFGVDVPEHKVVEVADKAYELVNMPWPAPASGRYVHAWNLPPWVAVGLDLVDHSGSNKDEDQAEQPDKEELIKRGLEVVMGMDPADLESEVYKLCERCPPSPETKVMKQMKSPFRLTPKQADADLMEIDRLVMEKRRREESGRLVMEKRRRGE